MKHIYTDNYLYDQQVRDDVENFREYLLTHESLRALDLHQGVYEFVLDVRYGDDNCPDAREWFVRHLNVILQNKIFSTYLFSFYYCVDHQTRSVFWLEPYNNPQFLTQAHGNPSHISTCHAHNQVFMSL